MRRVGFGLVIVTTLFAPASAFQTSADPQKPAVTAKGSAGDEDVPDLTIRQVTLKPGETLLVSCSDEGGDVEITWNGKSLHQDVAAKGSGFYSAIFSLYSAAGGTGDLVAGHVTGGDLSINAYSVTNLAASALDKTAAAHGTGTTPSSGATAATSHANEFVWGSIGYFANHGPTGMWKDGFTAGGQFTDTGGISGIEDGYKTVSSTGAYAAAKTGVNNDSWTALVATYATK
jgi:hypothetical protein